MKRRSEMELKEVTSSIFDEYTFEKSNKIEELNNSKNELVRLKKAIDSSERTKDFNILLTREKLREKQLQKIRSQHKMSYNDKERVHLKYIK